MSASAFDSTLAPVGLRDMLAAFFASARRLHATRGAAHAAQIRNVVNTYSDRAQTDAQLGRLDFAAIRQSSFRR